MVDAEEVTAFIAGEAVPTAGTTIDYSEPFLASLTLATKSLPAAGSYPLVILTGSEPRKPNTSTQKPENNTRKPKPEHVPTAAITIDHSGPFLASLTLATTRLPAAESYPLVILTGAPNPSS